MTHQDRQMSEKIMTTNQDRLAKQALGPLQQGRAQTGLQKRRKVGCSGLGGMFGKLGREGMGI